MSSTGKSRMVRFGVPVAAVAALSFATVNVIRAAESKPELAPPEAPPSTSFAERIGGVGIVEPASELIAMSVPVAGQVAEVLVKAGDDVKKGAALFRLDDRERRAELDVRRARATSARSRAASAEARLDGARARLRRLEHRQHCAEHFLVRADAYRRSSCRRRPDCRPIHPCGWSPCRDSCRSQGDRRREDAACLPDDHRGDRSCRRRRRRHG